MADLFSDLENDAYQPLAARMRPVKLADYCGQQHLLGTTSRCVRRLSRALCTQ